MAEHSMNVEIAHKLHEKKEGRLEGRLEILEAFLLAIVAVATAWSGYQAARWDGQSAASYAQATAYRVDGDNSITIGGEERLQDVSTFNTWLLAKSSGNEKMAGLLERRFSEDYEPAFRAWLAADPFNDPKAPPGPAFMPEYHNHLEKEGFELRHQATEAFELGRTSREIGEDYVRLTVFLATILFMVAIAQRFEHRLPRFGLLGIAAIGMGVTAILLIIYPQV
ncbi:MAG: hypothetical protein H7070_10975 [Saprospiraceae bacterium]|nr:hypothetical protein [Pyrinomonadaceae bacterium]